MIIPKTRWLLAVTLAGLSQAGLSQQLYIYPAQGQTPAQQERDQYECYSWARNNSGYDPVAAAAAGQPAPAPQKTGGIVKGALGGAAFGAVVGDSSEAAAKGAAVGALFGGIKQGKSNQQAQQQAGNQSATAQSNYDRAYAACLEGRGYTIK